MPEQDLGVNSAPAQHFPEIARANQTRGSIGNLSFPAKGLTHSILFVFKEYSYENLNAGFNLNTGTISNSGRSNGVTSKGVSSIELPFPTAISDSTGIVINNFERDKTTEAIARAASSMVNGAGEATISDIPQLLQQLGAGVSNVMTGGQNGPGVGGQVRSLVSRILGTNLKDATTGAQYLLRSKLPGDISRSIDIVTGQTINPRETLSFNGVELRSHSFTWQLMPESADDSSRIRNIVSGFKKQILPHTKDIAGIPNAYLTYPATVDAYLLGVNPEHFIKYKTSLVRSIDVEYGSGGLMSIMKGGKPASVNLSITMQELEIQTADEYGGTLVDSDTVVGGGGK